MLQIITIILTIAIIITMTIIIIIRTYIMIKPDGVQRGLVGEIITRFEKKGFHLAGLKLITPTRELLETHYEDLSSKPFFPSLIEYMVLPSR